MNAKLNAILFRIKNYGTPSGLKKGFNLLICKINRGKNIRVYYKPLSVTVNIEGRCNFKCKFCPYHGEIADNRYQDMRLSFEQVRREIDILVGFGIKHIHICGTGEPFLNKDIFKMFHYIRKKGATTSVLSNASILTPSHLQQVIDAQLDFFNTDLESVDEEEFKEITGRDCLKAVLSNIEQLVKLRNKTRSGMRIGVNTIISKDSLPKLKSILNKCRDLGVDSWCVHELVIGPEDKGYLTRDNKMLSKPKEIWVVIKELIPEAKEYNIKFIYPKYFDPDGNKSKFICLRPWGTFMLNIPNYDMPKEKWYGNVVCGCSEYNTHKYVYGNIFDKSLDEIWNGQPVKLLRKNLINNSDTECTSLCFRHSFI